VQNPQVGNPNHDQTLHEIVQRDSFHYLMRLSSDLLCLISILKHYLVTVSISCRPVEIELFLIA